MSYNNNRYIHIIHKYINLEIAEKRRITRKTNKKRIKMPIKVGKTKSKQIYLTDSLVFIIFIDNTNILSFFIQLYRLIIR